ncbi:MAG TPA: hypothetical protein VHP11_13780 [Tepidisphaeraceae bacterium]|nr:hypothetical protein [Tepidisphaeraceae bacterium]
MVLNTWNARLCGLAALVGASILSARSASAATVIDAFDSPEKPGPAYLITTLNQAAPITISNTMTGLTHVIGGDRTVDMTLVSGEGEIQTDINRYEAGVTTINSTDGVIGTFAFKYGFGPAGVLNANLSGDNAFVMDFADADQAGGVLTLFVTSGAGSDSAVTQNASVAIPLGGGKLAIHFSALSGINFADVDQLAFSITGPKSYDATIDNFATAVPLPSAAWAGLALLGTLGVNRIRKARNA